MKPALPLDVLALPLQGRHLIEASAGTGKTWTLAALYTRLVLERGLEPRQILVVTYTVAATAELQQRIRARLQQLLLGLHGGHGLDPFATALLVSLRAQGQGDDRLERRLRVALQGFDDAAISTIHGFCQRALAELPFTAGAPLALTLLEDERSLQLRLVQDHWRERVTRGLGASGDTLAPEVQTTLAALLLRRRDSPERWREQLARVLQRPSARLLWPQAAAGPGGSGDGALDLVHTLQTRLAAARRVWEAEREHIVTLLREARERLPQTRYKPEALEQAFDDWDTLLATRELQTALDKTRLALLGRNRLVPRKNEAALPQHAFFDLAQQLLDTLALAEREDSPLAALRFSLLRELLEQGPAQFAARKREARVQSFDDMLAGLHARLTGPRGERLAEALRVRYPAALIDEFQDTDAQQAAIFDAIYSTGATPAGERAATPPMFLLGDPKQAIYAFRGADLHSYLAAARRADARHTLAHNQRSTPQLIAALNALFAGHPRAFVIQGIAYEPVQAGAKPRPVLVDEAGVLGSAALVLWRLPQGAAGAAGADGADAADAAAGHGLLRKPAAQRRAAAATAQHIAQLLSQADRGAAADAAAAADLGARGGGERLSIDGRALAGGDIAVLVRTHREGALMRRALAARGVASIELSPQTVYATREAKELVRLLAAVVEPTRPERLHAALATTLLGFDAEALHRLAADNAALQGWIDALRDKLASWQAFGVGTLLRGWFAECRGGNRVSITERLLALPDGERRLTNLLHLAERLQQQEQASPSSPAALQRWLAERAAGARADDNESSQALLLRLESDRQLVQIVTLHRAKGLEYPIVFCPFAWDLTLPQERLEGLAYHAGDEAGDADDGHAVPVIDFRAAAKAGTVAERRKLESRAEAMRLLYVGLTRAVHRCYLVVGCWAAGQRRRPSTTTAVRSALNSLVAGGAMTPAEWLAHTLEPAQIDAAWSTFAAGAAPHVSLQPLPAPDASHVDAAPGDANPPARPAGPPARPWAPTTVYRAPRIDPERLAALPPPRRIAAPWRLASYSSLVAGLAAPSPSPGDADTRFDRAAADHDQATASAPREAGETADTAAAAPARDTDAGPDDILAFPRGAAAGECLHAVFERIDFAAPEGWPAVVAGTLQQHPLVAGRGRAASAPAALAPAVLRMLGEVMAAALPGGLVLGQVPASARVAELEFCLPARSVSLVALDALMRDAGLPGLGAPGARPTGAAPLTGYLRGFIDLVVRDGERWHVIDWKSNHLGTRAADYRGAALAQAMAEHGYALQALLYALALHRWLATRLRAYSPERHLGGVHYLFVRGIRQAWPAAGVHSWQPDARLLDAVSALFDAGDGR